jgi:hypothetical protein
MMKRIRKSTYELIGLPKEFGVILLTFGFILLVSPFMSGSDFGIFQVPQFNQGIQKTLRVAGPTVFAILVLLFVPIWKERVELSEESGSSAMDAYDRMRRVLARLGRSANGLPMVDGKPIPGTLTKYYEHYLAIAEFVLQRPGDVRGAYEQVWNHGGESRVFTNDTEVFETVVSTFFRKCAEVEKLGNRLPWEYSQQSGAASRR